VQSVNGAGANFDYRFWVVICVIICVIFGFGRNLRTTSNL
jgi:hypothetical protein